MYSLIHNIKSCSIRQLKLCLLWTAIINPVICPLTANKSKITLYEKYWDLTGKTLSLC